MNTVCLASNLRWLTIAAAALAMFSVSCQRDNDAPASKAPAPSASTISTPTPSIPTPPTPPSEFSVSFDTDGGAPAVSPQTVNEHGYATAPAPPPAKTGYTFGGWFRDSGRQTAFLFANEPITASIMLYAKWNKEAVVITYDLNGGSGTNPPAQTYTAAPLPLAQSQNLTRGDLYFIGWSTAKDDASSKVKSPYTPTGSATLYALWADNIFAFDAQKGVVTGVDNHYADRYDKTTLTRVTIPATIEGVKVTSIGTRAFSDYSALTRVTIPNGVNRIEWYAFTHCSALTNVIFPNGLTTIAASAFSGCSALANLMLPNSLKFIGIAAFANCRALNSLILPDKLETIAGEAFYNCTALASLSIPATVTFLGDEAFAGCTRLTVKFASTYPASLYDQSGRITAGIEDSVFRGVASIRVPDLRALSTYRGLWPKVKNIIRVGS